MMLQSHGSLYDVVFTIKLTSQASLSSLYLSTLTSSLVLLGNTKL